MNGSCGSSRTGARGRDSVARAGRLCAHSRVHTAKILRLSTDLPIIIEIVDTLEKIEAFLPTVDHAIPEGLLPWNEYKFGSTEVANRSMMPRAPGSVLY